MLETLCNFFDAYGEYSRQRINKNKSKFYTSNMSMARKQALASLTGFQHGSLPFTYLGIPLFKGKPKVVHLRAIADRLAAKMAGWKGKLLTIMGRVQLVNYVLSGMLAYLFVPNLFLGCLFT